MKELKIALFDDEETILPTLAEITRAAFAGRGIQTQTEVFCDTVSFVKGVQAAHFDLLMMDIHLPEGDGIAIAKKLRQARDCPEIIFVTNREERVFEAFSVHPVGFVRKSRLLQDITEAVGLYAELYARSKGQRTIVVQTRGGQREVETDQIVYIEGDRNYQNLYLNKTAQPLVLKTTMHDLEQGLAEFGFVRVQKGYLVNLRYIHSIDKKTAVLTTGIELPVSKRKSNEIVGKYLDYCRQRNIKMF